MGLKVIFIQFGVLLLKNCLVIIKQPKSLIYMYVPPLILSIFMVLVRQSYGPLEGVPKKQYNHVPIQQIVYSDYLNSYNLIISPKGCAACEFIAAEIRNSLKEINPSAEMDIKFMSNCNELEYDTSSNNIFKYFAGICFDDQLKNMTERVALSNLKPRIRLQFPSRLRYSHWSNILKGKMWNWQTSSIHRSKFLHGRESDFKYTSTPGYYEEGALLLIYLLHKASHTYFHDSHEKHNNTRGFWSICCQRFTDIDHFTNDLLELSKPVTPIIIMFYFSFALIAITKMILAERDMGLKEHIIISGAKPWVYWLTWHIFGVVLMLPLNLVLTFTLCSSFFYSKSIPALLPMSDPKMVYWFLVFYSNAVVSFGMFFSFFVIGHRALKFMGFLFFISGMPYYLVHNRWIVVNTYALHILMLLLNSVQAIGIQIIVRLEITMEGSHADNLSTFPYLCAQYTMRFVLIMLAVHCVMYYILALVMEAYFSGQFRTTRIWNCCKKKNAVQPEKSKMYGDEDTDDSRIKKIGIKMQGLKKVYNNQVVVRDFNFNVYEKDVTFIFGYNNSGKTHIVYMLTGISSPTEGHAYINDYSIIDNLNKVRRNLGYCPQKITLFEEMTVYYNFYIHGMLRELTIRDVENAVDHYTIFFQIRHLRNTPVYRLSLSDKKKLQIAIAFVGGSKIIIMDEPTSHMDFKDVVAVWELIDSEKHADRTILITSQNVNEACYLGDRIAVIQNGRIDAYGSKTYLTEKYNLQGYTLFIIKDPRCQCNTIGLKQLVNNHLPNAAFEEENEVALKFTLTEDDMSLYTYLFKQLDEQKEIFGIRDYIVRRDTLDTAYMKMYKATNEKKYKFPINFKKYEKKPVSMFTIMMYQHLRMGVYYWWTSLFKILGPAFVLFMLPVMVYDVVWLPPRTLTEHILSPVPIVIIEKNEDVSRDITGSNLNAFIALGVQVKQVEKSLVDYTYTTMLKETPGLARLHVLCGIQYISETEIIYWFNGRTFLHAPAVCLLGAVMKSLPGLSFHPLPYDIESNLASEYQIERGGVMLALLIIIAMCLIGEFSYYRDDNISKFRKLEFFFGGSPMWYWSTSFLWNFMLHLIMVFIIIFLLLIFQMEGLSSSDDLGAIAVLMVTFGWACIPLLQVSSFIYNKLEDSLLLIHCSLAIIIFIMVCLLRMTAYETFVVLSFRYLSIVSPYFVLGIAMYDRYTKSRTFSVCQCLHNRCIYNTDPLMVDVVSTLNNDTEKDMACRTMLCAESALCCDNSEGWELDSEMIYFAIVGATCFFVLMIKEMWYCRVRSSHRKQVDDVGNEDESVVQEKMKIRNYKYRDITENRIVVKNLTKHNQKHRIINGLCFHVGESACLSLYGNYGCGKSLTLDLVTGVARKSHGSVWIGGTSIRPGKMHKGVFTYSPNEDWLTPIMTVSEVIMHISLLCGYSFRDAQHISLELCSYYQISAYYGTVISKLPRNVKKIIMNAVTFIGNPTTIILDEPTQGMSPREKLLLWNNILYVRKNGTTILLSSKDIYECGLLGTRIAIMSNGSIIHIGNMHNLKSKLTSGAILIIEMIKPIKPNTKIKYDKSLQLQSKRIQKYLSTYLPHTVLLKQYMRTIVIHIVKYDSWSQVFEVLEKAKKYYPIETYALEEHSLYHRFIMALESPASASTSFAFIL